MRIFLTFVAIIAVLLGVSKATGRQLRQEEPAECSETRWDYSVCEQAVFPVEPIAVVTPPVGGTTLPANATGVATTLAPGVISTGAAGALGTVSLATSGATASQSAAASQTIGFTVGGAQDIENFRENIDQGYLPLPTDITFGGIVKDYSFDTVPTTTAAAAVACTELFCPLYSAASTADPLLVTAFQGPVNSSDIFLAVGLDSGLQENAVVRPPLNLVIVLDISGSMTEPFNYYYYDQFGNRQELTREESSIQKIDVAIESVVGALDQLGGDDRVSIVLFREYACTPLPLTPVRCLDIEQLKRNVQEDVVAEGSTNQEAGLQLATEQLKNCSGCMAPSLADVENRILLITDQQPNTGDVTQAGLGKIITDNAAEDVFVTIIGVGLDFNTELVQALGTTRGANYFSIHRPGEFQSRLVENFNYTVTPLVFDLSLKVQNPAGAEPNAPGWRILSVYGSPNPNDTAYAAVGENNTIMNVNTLFPSPKTEEGIRGGVILLRVAAPAGNSNGPLVLEVSYSDRSGNAFANTRPVQLPPEVLANTGPYYDSSGVRKAVLLARYSDLIRNWLVDEWRAIDSSRYRAPVISEPLCSVFPTAYCVTVSAYEISPADNRGCSLDVWLSPEACILPTPVPVFYELGEWERQSVDLAGHVNERTRRAIEEFWPYMESEIRALGNQAENLTQEVDILKKIYEA